MLMFQHSSVGHNQFYEPTRKASPMEIRDYIRILTKNWWIVAAGTLAGVLLGVGISALMTPTYQSTTTLYVSVRSGGAAGTGDLYTGASFAQAAVRSYVDVATTAIVLDRVEAELNLDLDAGELAESLKVSSPAESVLINIAAQHWDPQTAADLANTTSNVFIEVVENEIEITSDGNDSPVQVRMIDPATVPEDPASPNMVLNGMLGLIFGLTVGIGLAMLRGLLDTRIHSAQDIEHLTTTPVVGKIAQDDQISQRPLVVHDDPRSPRAEAFRSLRTNLQFLGSVDGSKVFVVTSPTPSDGKTHVVANLAIVLAESGAKVALVEADLRKPRLAQVMGIEGAAGLSDVLIDRTCLQDVLQPWGTENLTVLPAGQIPPNPSELLGSPRMQEVLDELHEQVDYVLVDAPPVLPVTDAAVLSGFTSGSILIAAVGKTKRQDLETAIEALETVEGNVLGIVLNRIPIRSAEISGQLSYKYDAAETEQRHRQRAR